MKKLFLLLAFFGTFALNNTYAQTTSTTEEATEMTAAEKAAAADEAIVVKTCEYSGTKSFYKKSTCAESGKVTMKKVSYNTSTNSFDAMPSADSKKKAGCSSAEKAACGSKAKAKTTAKSGKSGCCSSGAKKSCGDKKGKKVRT